MSGFIIHNFSKTIDIATDQYINRSVAISDLYVAQSTKNIFENDKCLSVDNNELFINEGVVLNKSELAEEYDIQSCDIVGLLNRIHDDKDLYFCKLRGSFSGAYYSSTDNHCMVYTNHYGDNAVFYYSDGNHWAASSQIDWLLELLAFNNIRTSLNYQAVYRMLSYGYMPDDSTYVNEIGRLYPGHYLDIKDGILADRVYYEAKRNKLDLSGVSRTEAIEQIDYLFRRAVKREFDKDTEYARKHLVELSGGLDSRMNYWVANELGYQDILAITFGQANCLDEKIAKEIVDYWKGEIVVWPMNGAKHLFDLDRIVDTNFGLSIYSGIGSELRIMDALDMNNYGLIHTGQLGDVVIGTFIHSPAELDHEVIAGRYSDMLSSDKEINITGRFDNLEEQLMMVRGMLGCMSSHYMPRLYTEVASPFLDVDLMDYCMSLPIEWRINHSLYKEWIMTKYPDAANFKWEKINARIDESKVVLELKKIANIIQWNIKNPRRLMLRLGVVKSAPQPKLTGGMNPVDLWYNNVHGLREFFDSTYAECIKDDRIPDELRSDFNTLFNKGSVVEKIQVLTALKAITWYGKYIP